MIPLSTAISSGLSFSSNWQGFELKQDDQLLGTLKRPRMWSSEFTAAIHNQGWLIRRSGFWGNKGEILDAASQQQIAAFKSAWGGKTSVLFVDGQVFFIVTRGLWHPVWTVRMQSSQLVLTLQAHEKTVELHADATIPADRLLLLVLLTLYRVCQAEEAAELAAAAAS